jgi:hypothetical protein
MVNLNTTVVIYDPQRAAAAGMAFPSGVEFTAENGGGAGVRMKIRRK